jgi:hypothetical protein
VVRCGLVAGKANQTANQIPEEGRI